MKKIITFCVLTVLFFANTQSLSAAPAGQLDIIMKVINSKTAELTITYPTPFYESVFNVLPSKLKSISGIDGTYTLSRVVNMNGVKREFGDFQDGGSDAIVYIDAKDTSISVTYLVTNAINVNDLSLFRFPLILGGNYPLSARVRVIYPTTMGVLSYPNSENYLNVPAKVDTIITAPLNTNSYYGKDISVLLYKKSNAKTGYISKKIGTINLVTPRNLDANASAVIKDVAQTLPEYSRVLGQSLPQNIVVAVAPIGNSTVDYESSAVQLSKNVILFDSLHMGKNVKDYAKKTILTHELTHVALANAKLFRDEQVYSAKIFDEGVASFMSLYLAEKYFYKNIKKSDIALLPDGYRKMKLEDYVKQFKNSFDYTFTAPTTETQSIDYTYGHSGLIFYTLFLKDKNIIAKTLAELKNTTSAGNCGVCDSETVINVISRLTGMSKEDIMFPNKNDLLNGTTSSSTLLINQVLF